MSVVFTALTYPLSQSLVWCVNIYSLAEWMNGLMKRQWAAMLDQMPEASLLARAHHGLQIQSSFPLARGIPGLWSLVVLAPVIYNVWKKVKPLRCSTTV